MFPRFNKATDRLIRIQVLVRRPDSNGSPLEGSIENEIDADGGKRVGTLMSSSYQGTETISSIIYQKYNIDCNIKWSERYSYRLGFSNVYRFGAIRLYKNNLSSVAESNISAGEFSTTGSTTQWNYHCGINLNPSNRNKTGINTEKTYSK